MSDNDRCYAKLSIDARYWKLLCIPYKEDTSGASLFAAPVWLFKLLAGCEVGGVISVNLLVLALGVGG